MKKLKFFIAIAYIPTLIMIVVTLALLVFYLQGWRILLLPPEAVPTLTPVPYKILTKEPLRWN
jgi:hypothetical protein